MFKKYRTDPAQKTEIKTTSGMYHSRHILSLCILRRWSWTSKDLPEVWKNRVLITSSTVIIQNAAVQVGALFFVAQRETMNEPISQPSLPLVFFSYRLQWLQRRMGISVRGNSEHYFVDQVQWKRRSRITRIECTTYRSISRRLKQSQRTRMSPLWATYVLNVDELSRTNKD